MASLDGIRILSLALNLPGPVAVSLLVKEGARVIKLEPPAGDPLKSAAPDYYRDTHKDQSVRNIDLKTEEGEIELNIELGVADIFITSFRPKALKAMGIDWENLHPVFPRLNMISVIGDESDPDKAGHDLTYQAEKGFLDPPFMPKTCWADIATAQQIVISAFAILRERDKDGLGHLRTVSISGSLEIFGGPMKSGLTRPGGMLGGGFAGYRIYQAREGWIALAALELKFQIHLLDNLSKETLGPDTLQEIFLTRTADEWESFGKLHDIPITALR